MLGIFIIETSFQQRQQPARQGSTRGTRWPFAISPPLPLSLSLFLLQTKLQSGDLETPLLVVVVVALITNASCWQKSSWLSKRRQASAQELQHREQRTRQGVRGEGRGDSARVMARQAHALCEQVKRLTVRRRIGSDRSEVEVGVRVKRSLVLAGRQANWGGRGVGYLPGQAVVGLCLLTSCELQRCHCSEAAAVAAAAHAPQRSPQFIYFKTWV